MKYSFRATIYLLFTLFSTLGLATEWSKQEKEIIHSLSLYSLQKPKPSLSNRFADDPDAARLGKRIFFDRRFSQNKKISCASCHQPAKYFADDLPKAVGIEQGNRNTPTIVASAWQNWFAWDGRKDSLWSQSLAPFEGEMGSPRERVARLLFSDASYMSSYRNLFGTIPA